MTSEIPDLWSEKISVDVRTPAAILNFQAGKLKERTQGILIAELTQETMGDVTELRLDLIAPAANNIRVRVLMARHNIDEVYPAVVAGSGVNWIKGMGISIPDRLSINGVPTDLQYCANTEEEFILAVRTILGSRPVLSKIQSLIARSNEGRNALQGVSSEPDSK